MLNTTYQTAVDAFTRDRAAELIYLVGSYMPLATTINGYATPLPDQD